MYDALMRDARGADPNQPGGVGYGYTPIVELRHTGERYRERVVAIRSRQVPIVQVLKRKDPTLHLPDNLWGRTAKLQAQWMCLSALRC